MNFYLMGACNGIRGLKSVLYSFPLLFSSSPPLQSMSMVPTTTFARLVPSLPCALDCHRRMWCSFLLIAWGICMWIIKTSNWSKGRWKEFLHLGAKLWNKTVLFSYWRWEAGVIREAAGAKNWSSECHWRKVPSLQSYWQHWDPSECFTKALVVFFERQISGKQLLMKENKFVFGRK